MTLPKVVNAADVPQIWGVAVKIFN